MPLSASDLRTIAEQAINLRELLEAPAERSAAGESIGRLRLERWRKIVGGNSADRFDSVLKAVDLAQCSDSDLPHCLCPIKLSSNAELPRWTSTLAEICAALPTAIGRPNVAATAPWSQNDAARVPYIHLLWPITEHARRQVEAAQPDHRAYPSVAAWVGLQRHLVTRISRIVSEALQPSFLAYQSLSCSGMFSHFGASAEISGARFKGQTGYFQFIRHQAEDGMRGFWLRFPVAARLVAVVTLQWIEFVTGFLQRLTEDMDRLQARFNGRIPLGGVSALEAGVSDPHEGGQSVLILTFLGGRKLVYKPRSMAVDQLFFGLIASLNARPSFPDCRTLPVLDRGTYGWMEFVQASPCPGKIAAKRFYQRAGALACVLHWLRAIDCHRENVVAAGEYPTLIDLETLEHPMRVEEQSQISEDGNWVLVNSALRTGLLPLWQPRLTAEGYYDDTGLGGNATELTVERLPTWRAVNTDRMARILSRRTVRYSRHRPRLHGRVLSVKDFEANVVAGYRATAELLESGSNQKLLDWRIAIRRSLRRHVKTPTAIYMLLLRRSLQPEMLTDGVSRSLELHALPCESGSEEQWKQEITSLERLDIPYFRVGSQTPTQATSDATDPRNLASQLPLVRLSARRQLLLHEGRLNRIRGKQKPS